MQRNIGLSGNPSGSLDRASSLEKARLKEKRAFEEKKRELEIRRQKSSFSYVDNLFEEVSHQEDEKESTKTAIVKASDNNNNNNNNSSSSSISKTGKHQKKSKSKEKMKRKLLSFEKDEDNDDNNSEGDNDDNNSNGDNGEEGRRRKKRRKQEGGNKDKDDEDGKKKSLKNPSVRTDFLPDKERDLRELELREQLKQEWLAEQEKIKKEQLEVVYSWWDGSGHRRKVQVSKGTTVLQFLSLVKTQLALDFRDVERVHTNDLMYIKEDLIIPNNYSFYDLIITKARGKSGPLFHFDVHEDVRLKQDVRVEKDESHPGKVCDRRWYERNKHIFPYNRWETYDPSKTFDKYTIHGGIVNKTKK